MSFIAPITAAGNSQATATPINNLSTSKCLVIGTVPAGSGIILPALEIPISVLVSNQGANALSIYPPVGGTINGGSVNSPYTLNAGSSISLYAAHSTTGPVDYYTY